MSRITVATVAWRELRRLLRDPNLVLVLFIAPLAYTALYGSIYWNKAECEVPVAVINVDGGALARRLVADVDALQDVRVAGVYRDEAIGQRLLARGSVHGLLVIPATYERDLKRGSQATVHLVLSPGRLLVLSDVGIGISKAVATNGARVTGATLARQEVPVIARPEYTQPLGVIWSPLFNPWLTYGDMILPALLAIILLQLAFIGSAAATASEWHGGWKQLSAQRDGRPSAIVAGKMLLFVAVMSGFSVLVRLLVVPLFDVRIAGDTLALALLLALAFAAAAAMGLFVGSYFRHRLTAFIVLGFSSYPLFMLSGYAWPDGQLVPWLRIAARLLPTTPFLQGIAGVSQMGGGMVDAWMELANLAILSLLYGGLAQWRFRRISREITAADPHA